MSENKKKFPLRWIIGILLVAAFEFYTWRNGRSVDDYGNVGPLDAISMLMMLVASSVVVFGIIFLITAIQKTLADKRREEAELAAAAQALEEVEQTLEELHGPDGSPADSDAQGELCATRTPGLIRRGDQLYKFVPADKV